MMTAVANDTNRSAMTVYLERRGAAPGAAAPEFGVGLLQDQSSASGRRVLAPLGSSTGDVVDVPSWHILDVPREMTAETALMAPALAEALRLWDVLEIELGAAAVVTQGTPWSSLVSLAARWYGGVVVPLGGAGGRAPGAGETSDADAVTRFTQRLSEFPAVYAVELSGRADAVDLLLEAIPKYARVMFAGPRQERLTIDYYVNVHRKGIHLVSTVPNALRMFQGGEAERRLVERALRLLSDPARAAACHEALAGTSVAGTTH